MNYINDRLVKMIRFALSMLFCITFISHAQAGEICLSPDAGNDAFKICALVQLGEKGDQGQKFVIHGFSNYGYTEYWDESDRDISAFKEFVKFGILKEHFYYYHEPRRLGAHELCEIFGKAQLNQFASFSADHSQGRAMEYDKKNPIFHSWNHNPHRPSVAKQLNNYFWKAFENHTESKRLRSVSCVAH